MSRARCRVAELLSVVITIKVAENGAIDFFLLLVEEIFFPWGGLQGASA